MFVGLRDWTRTHGVSVAGNALLTVVVASVAAMSWQGLVGFAEMFLHLHGPSRYMVPVSLDGAGAACAFLSLRAIIRQDSAAGPRLMVWLFIAASATFNVLHAQRAFHDAAAAVFFGGMSVAAVLLFDIVLRSLRRQALRRIGAIEEPLPRFRALRWLVAFGETFAAWRISIREGLTRPEDALALARRGTDDAPRMGAPGNTFYPSGEAFLDHMEELTGDAERPAIAAVPSAAPAPRELVAMSKADAVRAALVQTEGNVPAALEWLAARGVRVDRAYAYDVRSGRSGRRSRISRDTEAPDESHNTEDSGTDAA